MGSIIDDVWSTGEDAYDDFQEWNNPEELEGAVGQRDIGDDAEQILQEQYGWSEEDADDAVPDNTVEAISNSWDGVQQAGSDTATAAGDVYNTVQNPASVLPDWLPIAGGVGLLLTAAAVLSYAFGQLVTVNTEV